MFLTEKVVFEISVGWKKKYLTLTVASQQGVKIQAEFLMSWLSCRQPHSTSTLLVHSFPHKLHTTIHKVFFRPSLFSKTLILFLLIFCPCCFKNCLFKRDKKKGKFNKIDFKIRKRNFSFLFFKMHIQDVSLYYQALIIFGTNWFSS